MTSTRNGERNRSAIVTGAGSGLGRDITLGLAAKGYRVFGTAMSLDEIADLKKVSGGAVNLGQCDITNEAAVKAWAGEVSIQNEGRIDLLVSNSGILTPGPLEVLPLNAVRHEFEVNVFGALAVVNSFLPALRKARGRIVQVSTMTDRHSRHFSSKMIGALPRDVIAGLNTLDSYRSPDSRRACQSFSMSLQEPATLSGLHQQRFS
jgi:NAD(P)-dependent dehydrogenase (short-subunit alcohol dehydrogenase family)